MTLGGHSVPSHPTFDLPTIKRAASGRVTGQTLAIAATTIYTPATSRLYLVVAEILCTAAGGADRTVTLTFRNTDDVGATSVALGPFALNATGRTLPGMVAVFQSKPGSAITYETAVAGVAGAAGTYSIYFAITEIQ